ncbi:MAG: hypothetical protein JO037_25165 [Actinobacteria bacterium]|nr:hypothetical protein [Actinomycetota bacterium]
MPKIIVLGAGVCGLAAGMLLAGDGHQTAPCCAFPGNARTRKPCASPG